MANTSSRFYDASRFFGSKPSPDISSPATAPTSGRTDTNGTADLLENEVYSNVDIELPGPPPKEPCEGLSTETGEKKGGCGCKKSSGYGPLSHPLWWLGGIAGALFLMGRSSK